MVSHLCIQWQHAWRIYFLFTASPLFCYFAVLYNLCFMSALFLTAALWLLPKLANVLLLYKWTVYTHTTKQSYPNCAFYYWLLCVKLLFFVFFLLYFLILNFFWSFKKKKNRLELILPFCHVFLDFFFHIQLLLKISWFLKYFSVAACGVCLLFLPLLSL